MAEILPNTSNDIGNRGCTNTTLAQFKGKPRQVLVNIEDAYRLVVMDGSTLGGKFKAASLDELNLYATKAEVTQSLASKEDKGACLPLTGGTLTGPLFMTENTHISAVQDENFKGLELGGGAQYKDGAALFLRSNSATGEGESGLWGLVAHHATSSAESLLIGRVGHLLFDGAEVERSNEIFGSVIDGGFYEVYRYATGLQIIIAGVTIPGNQIDVTFTFPRPFINQSYSIAANAYTENGDIAVTWGSDTTTSIKLYRKYYNGNFDLPTYVKCAFIGKWK